VKLGPSSWSEEGVLLVMVTVCGALEVSRGCIPVNESEGVETSPSSVYSNLISGLPVVSVAIVDSEACE
jgi:hypothetical protein